MRRKKSGSKSDIIIDLTSLLDVIFIMLLVVLCGQSSINESLAEEQSKVEHALIQAESEYQLYKDQIETADSLNQYVWAVSIVVPYNEKEITQRQIRLLNEGKEIENFDLIGNDVTSTIDTFRESLVGFIQENKDRPVILSLNEEDENILYRDEIMVNEILKELSKEYSNVYIKGKTGEDTK